MELERAGEAQSYIVRIHYALHKKTDPAAEFEAYATDPGYLESDHVEFRTEHLDGLGEEAIETAADNGSGMTTWVRDGGAVLTLTVSTTHQQYGITEDSPDYVPQLDVAATRELIKADLAELMAALQK